MITKSEIVEVLSIGTPCDDFEIEKIKNFLKINNYSANVFLENETKIKNKFNHEFAIINAEIRFKQFKMAWENPHSKIIWCSRGGYGSAEIIEFIDSMSKPENKKIFIGFSDITSVNIYLNQRWSIPTICAAMLVQCAFDMVSIKSTKTILDLISNKIDNLIYDLKNLKNIIYKEISGELVGGCVSVIAGNFSTKNQINWHKKILFLEDEGEDGERLDRYFQQIVSIIKESGQKPSAIILGNFLQGNIHGSPKADNIAIAIKKLIEKTADIPLFQEKNGCLGHSIDIMPIITGCYATISNNILRQSIKNIF